MSEQELSVKGIQGTCHYAEPSRRAGSGGQVSQDREVQNPVKVTMKIRAS